MLTADKIVLILYAIFTLHHQYEIVPVRFFFGWMTNVGLVLFIKPEANIISESNINVKHYTNITTRCRNLNARSQKR